MSPDAGVCRRHAGRRRGSADTRRSAPRCGGPRSGGLPLPGDPAAVEVADDRRFAIAGRILSVRPQAFTPGSARIPNYKLSTKTGQAQLLGIENWTLFRIGWRFREGSSTGRWCAGRACRGRPARRPTTKGAERGLSEIPCDGASAVGGHLPLATLCRCAGICRSWGQPIRHRRADDTPGRSARSWPPAGNRKAAPERVPSGTRCRSRSTGGLARSRRGGGGCGRRSSGFPSPRHPAPPPTPPRGRAA